MLNARFYLTISSHDLNKFNFEMINNCCFGHLVLWMEKLYFNE